MIHPDKVWQNYIHWSTRRRGKKEQTEPVFEEIMTKNYTADIGHKATESRSLKNPISTNKTTSRQVTQSNNFLKIKAARG